MGKAIAAVLLGIVSFVIFNIRVRVEDVVIIFGVEIILGIIGLLLGITGLNEINYFKEKGRAVAVLGIVFGIIGIIFPILLLTSSDFIFWLFNIGT